MKKETLEEAAEKLTLEYQLGNTGKIDIEDAKEMLIEFAKLQSERSYSEEESFENKSLKWWMSLSMDEQIEIGFKYDMPTFNLTLRAIMHEFEQFKKK